jgi:adenylyltransferase/sulfurtransferase
MTIHIPTPLRAYTNGQESIDVNAGTVATALEDLVTLHPGLRQNLFGNDGKLRSFVNVYLNEEDIRYLQSKEDTVTRPADELTIIPSIAGGSTPLPALARSR